MAVASVKVTDAKIYNMIGTANGTSARAVENVSRRGRKTSRRPKIARQDLVTPSVEKCTQASLKSPSKVRLSTSKCPIASVRNAVATSFLISGPSKRRRHRIDHGEVDGLKTDDRFVGLPFVGINL